MEEQAEETLSISFVDGISCGLAAALLLFIIFGINVSISNSSLGGVAGHGTVTKAPNTGLTKEPIDIIVEVIGPASSFVRARWGRALTTDHIVQNKAQDSTVLVRQLQQFTVAGIQVAHDDIALNLDWNGPIAPEGFIDVFRSGAHSASTFHCDGRLTSYAIITGFDLRRNLPHGSCTIKQRD